MEASQCQNLCPQLKEVLKTGEKVPFLNPDTKGHWVGCKTITKILVEGQECKALLNSGSQVSAVTPTFVQEHGLQVLKLEDLTDEPVNILSIGGMHTTPVRFTVA